MTKKDIKKTIQEVRANSVFNTGKQVVKYMTGAGTYAIVESIVTMAVPVTIKLPVRLCVRLASVVIGAMASDKTAKYSEELIDESLDMIEEIVDVSLPEDKAELEAAKREDYIQKRTEAKTSNKESREEVANRIVDLTFSGAPEEEIAKAVQHSIEIIDAEKVSPFYAGDDDPNFKFSTEKEAKDAVTKARAWIKLNGGDDYESDKVQCVFNPLYIKPYVVIVAPSILNKYPGVLKLMEGGSLNG